MSCVCLGPNKIFPLLVLLCCKSDKAAVGTNLFFSYDAVWDEHQTLGAKSEHQGQFQSLKYKSKHQTNNFILPSGCATCYAMYAGFGKY